MLWFVSEPRISWLGRNILVFLAMSEGCAAQVREVGSIGVENGGHVIKIRVSALSFCGSGFGYETLTAGPIQISTPKCVLLTKRKQSHVCEIETYYTTEVGILYTAQILQHLTHAARLVCNLNTSPLKTLNQSRQRSSNNLPKTLSRNFRRYSPERRSGCRDPLA